MMYLVSFGRIIFGPPWIALHDKAVEGSIMRTLRTSEKSIKNRFDIIAQTFLQKTRLSFPSVLGVPSILRAFKNKKLFWRAGCIRKKRLFFVRFWLEPYEMVKELLVQPLVADKAAYLLQTSYCPSSGNTSDYCLGHCFG